jgi:hypothetical protein
MLADVGPEKLEHSINRREELSGESGLVEKVHVITNLEDPEQGEARNNLLDVRWIAGLSDSFGEKRRGETDDRLLCQPIIP